MNRKNTILIAVMVNASLLVLLFITALTTQEEIFVAPSMQMAGSASLQQKGAHPELQKPLFEESSDRALMQTASSEVKTSVSKVSEPAASIEVPVLHALPPRAEEMPVANAGSSVASANPSPSSASNTAAVAPSDNTTSMRPAQNNTASALPSGYKVVIVKKGDSLDKIAKEYSTSVDEIIKINHLPSSFLRIGQSLKVPPQKQGASSQKARTAAVKETDSIEYYTVKVGDNPWTIAMKHQIKVEELLRLNGLNEEKARKLKPGDRLRTR